MKFSLFQSLLLPFGSEPFECLRLLASPISSFDILTMSVSAEEVAKHNTDKDCWVIVGDQVRDVTNFLSRSDADQFLLQHVTASVFQLHVARIVSYSNRAFVAFFLS